MRLLAIETSGRRGGVALFDGDRLLEERILDEGMRHGRALAPAVDELLRKHGLRPSALGAVAADIGPGSFTGLRVGLAFAKTLCKVLRLMLVGVPSLDVTAASAPASADIVAAFLDARWEQVYAALYRREGGELRRESAYRAGLAADLVAEWPEGTTVIGTGLERHAELVRARGLAAAPTTAWDPSPAALGRLGLERLARGLRDDVDTLVPLYLAPVAVEAMR